MVNAMQKIKGPAIFLAQFIGDEAPFNGLPSLCKWAASLGYKGIQLPTDPKLIDLSTIGSTQILMNSTSKKFPNGIANSSGVLGHYLMDHNYNSVASGDIDGFENEYYSGRRPSGLMMPNFYYKPDPKRGFLRGYALGASAYREGWDSQQHQDGLGVEYKNKIKQAGKWRFGLYAQGEMLPRFENQMRLHPTLKDKWGIPQIEFDVRFSENEKLMMEDAAEQSIKMLKAAGLKNVSGHPTNGPPGLAIHELG